MGSKNWTQWFRINTQADLKLGGGGVGSVLEGNWCRAWDGYDQATLYTSMKFYGINKIVFFNGIGFEDMAQLIRHLPNILKTQVSFPESHKAVWWCMS